MNKPTQLQQKNYFFGIHAHCREVQGGSCTENLIYKVARRLIGWTDPTIPGELRRETTGALNMG